MFIIIILIIEFKAHVIGNNGLDVTHTHIYIYIYIYTYIYNYIQITGYKYN